MFQFFGFPTCPRQSLFYIRIVVFSALTNGLIFPSVYTVISALNCSGKGIGDTQVSNEKFIGNIKQFPRKQEASWKFLINYNYQEITRNLSHIFLFVRLGKGSQKSIFLVVDIVLVNSSMLPAMPPPPTVILLLMPQAEKVEN